MVKGERKEPPSDRIKVGLESYVDPDYLSLGACAGDVNLIAAGLKGLCSSENAWTEAARSACKVVRAPRNRLSEEPSPS